MLAPDSRGTTWDAIREGFGDDVAFLNRALEHVFSRLAVDPARVAIGGFSDGASYAISLGLANGDLFPRIAAFSPGFIVGAAPHGHPRVFVSHGTSDQILPINRCSRVHRAAAAGERVRCDLPRVRRAPRDAGGNRQRRLELDRGCLSHVCSRMNTAAKTHIGPSDWLEGVDTRLEVMSAQPLVLSTPVSLLAEQRITDKKYLFVRNIQDLPEAMTMEPLPLHGWEIELTGLIEPLRLVDSRRRSAADGAGRIRDDSPVLGQRPQRIRRDPGHALESGRSGQRPLRRRSAEGACSRSTTSTVDPQVKYVTAGGRDAAMGLERADLEHSIPDRGCCSSGGSWR